MVLNSGDKKYEVPSILNIIIFISYHGKIFHYIGIAHIYPTYHYLIIISSTSNQLVYGAS